MFKYFALIILISVCGCSRSIICSPSDEFVSTLDLLATTSQSNMDEAEKWLWNGGKYWSKDLATQKLNEMGEKHQIVIVDKGTKACYDKKDSTWLILSGEYKGKKLYVLTDPTLVQDEEGVNL